MEEKVLNREVLFDEIKKNITNEDSLKLINKAYDYAYKKHDGQFRKSGEPYFVHLLNVAYELAKLKTGPNTICAGLLHDVIEDCGVTKDEFIEEFGEDIYEIVEAVTKISALSFKDEKEYQAENHRKILIAMAKDIRVILVKLCDRLHNMRTLQFQPEASQKRIAKETLEVYAPIAHRLGLAEIKNELEDLCFYYLDHDKYHEIATLVASKKSQRDDQINAMIKELSKMLDEHKIPYRIFGRSKHFYSIHKKMVKKNKRFDEILDLLAIRIVTETELNCYEILGYIHQYYRPIPGRMKDYIAVPKFNMYQSLHTTVVGVDGSIFEIQIRTEKMDEIAEKGVAAHWSYKESKGYNKSEQKEIIKELEWLKAFENDSEKNASQYMNEITQDIFNANIYVMTPLGRIIDLPSGSTPIDFAYRIHSEIGNHTVGATINGALVPLNTELHTGDVVELRTNKSSAPSRDWLKIVKTSGAKNKIRRYFTKLEAEQREGKIEEGKKLLLDAFKNREIDPQEYLSGKKFDQILSGFQLSNEDDFYYAIGVKSISCLSVVERITKIARKELEASEINEHIARSKFKTAKTRTGVEVSGIDSMKIELAPCCKPVYGDEILGYVTKGQGIKVHRSCCPNIKGQSRIIDVHWEEADIGLNYDASIRVDAKDRNFLLTDLMTVISQYKANISYVNVTTNREDLSAVAHLTITVHDKTQLDNIMTNLKKVPSVYEVDREIK